MGEFKIYPAREIRCLSFENSDVDDKVARARRFSRLANCREQIKQRTSTLNSGEAVHTEFV